MCPLYPAQVPPISVPDRAGIRSLVSALLSDREELVRLAALSFRHPNSFDRLVVASNEARPRIRVHVWWASDEGGAEHVHNHPWSFASRVLVGQLAFETYRVLQATDARLCHDHSKVEDGFMMFRCPAPAESTAAYHYSFQIEGPVHLEPSGEWSLPAGSKYALDSREFHRIASRRSTTTITALVHGPVVQPESRLVVPRSVSLADGHVVPKFTPDEFGDLLGRVLEALS